MPWSASVSSILDGVYEWKMHLPVGMRQHMGILPGGNASNTPVVRTLVCVTVCVTAGELWRRSGWIHMDKNYKQDIRCDVLFMVLISSL